MRQLIIILLTFVTLTSCGSDPIPKPKGYLRLEYPQADYKTYNQDLPFAFDAGRENPPK